MAVTNEKSTQITALENGERLPPGQANGVARITRFNHTQAASGDANSTVDLCKLPNGVITMKSLTLRIDALGAGRTLNIGHRAYTDPDGNSVAENLTAFVNGLSVAAATNTEYALPFDWKSKDGIMVVAQVVGGTLDAGKNIRGAFDYANE